MTKLYRQKVQVPTTCVTVTEPARGKLVSAQPKHHGDSIASYTFRSADSKIIQRCFSTPHPGVAMRGLPPLPQENLSGECDPSPVGDREREVTGTTCPLRHSPHSKDTSKQPVQLTVSTRHTGPGAPRGSPTRDPILTALAHHLTASGRGGVQVNPR